MENILFGQNKMFKWAVTGSYLNVVLISAGLGLGHGTFDDLLCKYSEDGDFIG